jgi:hypothetical protein
VAPDLPVSALAARRPCRAPRAWGTASGPTVPRVLGRWLLALAIVGLGIAWLTTAAHAASPPPSQQSTCTPDMRVCFNELASTPDATGWTIRANVDDSTPVTGQVAYRRAILIFHLTRDPDTGRYVPYLVAQAPWCIAVSNCIVTWHTDDPFAMSMTLWWGATFDNHNRILVARVGYPSP